MSRLMTKFQIFLALMFFTGIDVSNASKRYCEWRRINFQEEFDSIKSEPSTEVRYKFCTNMKTFFNCLNNTWWAETGLTIRELANNLIIKRTYAGDFFNNIVKREDNLKEICQTDFLKDTFCFNPLRSKISRVSVKHCRMESGHAYITLRELQPNTDFSVLDDECILNAYQLGCVAATIYAECGVEAFNTYKNTVKSNGYLRSGPCSPDLMETLKTTLLESLDMTESQKNLYCAIFDLQGKRK